VRFALLIAAIGLLVFLILFQQSLQNGLINGFIGAIRDQNAPVLVYSVDGQRVLQGSVITPEMEAQVRAAEGVGDVGPIAQGTFTGQPSGNADGKTFDTTLIGYELGPDGDGIGAPTTLVEGTLPTADNQGVVSDADVTLGYDIGDVVTLLPGGKVLIAGGEGNLVGLLASGELYDPVAGTFTSTGSLATARYQHTATLLSSGKVLIAGGLIEYFETLASAEMYDPATGTFTGTGSLTTARFAHTATPLPSGEVLIAGGLAGPAISALLASAELYDPAAGTFTTTGSLATARGRHTETLLPNGKVLIVGGAGTSGTSYFYLASAELYGS